jgi:hypothetical protein
MDSLDSLTASWNAKVGDAVFLLLAQPQQRPPSRSSYRQVPVKLTLSTSDITSPTDVKPLYVGLLHGIARGQLSEAS